MGVLVGSRINLFLLSYATGLMASSDPWILLMHPVPESHLLVLNISLADVIMLDHIHVVAQG